MFIWHFRSLTSVFTLVAVTVVLISAGLIMIRRRLGTIPFAYLLVLIVCTAAAEIAISVRWRPIFYYRVIIWTVPFFYILVAFVITSLRSSRAVAVLLSGVAIIFILDMWAHYRKPVDEDYRTLVAEVYNSSRDGDVIVTMQPWVAAGIKYYLAKHPPRALALVDRSTTEMRAIAHLPPASVEPLPPTTHRVWLIGRIVGDDDPDLRAHLAPYHFVRRYDEHGVSAELYQDSAGGS
jgi:hypothetical protein